MIKNFLNNNDAKLQKIFLILTLSLLVLLVPLAAQNQTGESQPLEEQIDLCKNVICNNLELECSDKFTASCSNSCDSETGECSSCQPSCTGHENSKELEVVENLSQTSFETTSQPKENITDTENKTSQPTLEFTIEEQSSTPGFTKTTVETPELGVQVIANKKITRGETIVLKTIIINLGEIKAENISINWIFPSNFKIINGQQQEILGNLDSGDSILSKIEIQTNYYTPLGVNEIKVLIDYKNE